MQGPCLDLQMPVHLQVSQASANARAKVTKAGGSVTTVYYNKLGEPTSDHRTAASASCQLCWYDVNCIDALQIAMCVQLRRIAWWVLRDVIMLTTRSCCLQPQVSHSRTPTCTCDLARPHASHKDGVVFSC